MNIPPNSPVANPISALNSADTDGVLAVIIRVDGPSYRPVGAMMAIFVDGRRVGTLSSGCIENDLALHAKDSLKTNRPKRVIYGLGSPYIDIQLPCGGGLEILLLPRPDRAIIAKLAQAGSSRRACTLEIDMPSGTLSISQTGETENMDPLFSLHLVPETLFYIFGKGPEAGTFAAMVQSAGFPNILASPDRETLEFGKVSGCETRHLKTAGFPADLHPDAWSAVVLFFHDHEWEPPILKAALASDAFYIGAQGSQKARDSRLREIAALGVSPQDIARLKGPIGLVPSARDARTLAVSVFAEVLSLV